MFLFLYKGSKKSPIDTLRKTMGDFMLAFRQAYNLYVFSHGVGLIHSRVVADLAGLPDTGSVKDAFFMRVGQAFGGEPTQTIDCALQVALIRISCGDDEVKVFARNLRVPGDSTVDERFHLGVHRVKVDRRGQNDYIGLDHFIQDFRHVVLLDTLVSAGTGFAAGTVSDLSVAQKYFFRVMTRLARPPQEFPAEGVGIASLSGTGG
ncbi:hypothetical protein AusDCA_2492 [Desulfitobacterium sp. AusDCA]